MGFWRVLYRCGRTIGHLMVGEFTVTGVSLFLFAFLVGSWEIDGKAERRCLGTSPCDNEITIELRTNALRAYQEKSSELIPPGPRSRVGTHNSFSLDRSVFTWLRNALANPNQLHMVTLLSATTPCVQYCSFNYKKTLAYSIGLNYQNHLRTVLDFWSGAFELSAIETLG